MAEEKKSGGKPKKITVVDFADEQKPEEQIDLKAEEKVLDDETIEESVDAEQTDSGGDEKTEDGGSKAENEISEQNDLNEVPVEEQQDESDGEIEVEEDQLEQQEDEQPADPEFVPENTTPIDDEKENDAESEEVKKPNGVDEDENSSEESTALSEEDNKRIEEEWKLPEQQEDPELDAAVDDVVRAEADDVLVLDDAIKEPDEPEIKGFKKIIHNIKHGFQWWWHHALIRNFTFLLLFLGIMAVAIIPTTRYGVLNIAGVRVSSSMRVLDEETSLPLKNITVKLQDKEIKTDEEGLVEFSDLKLGNSQLVITRRGYAESNETIILGLGSNPLGDKRIVATGVQYSFELKDWLSGVIVTDADADAGEYSAKADDKGEITITLSEDADEDIDITINAEGYRSEIFSADQLSLSDVRQVFLVNDRKHLFVSNRDSQYDIYSIDLDGQNEEVFMQATGKERDIPLLYPHPSKHVWAVVGSHQGETNSDGYILDGLFVADTRSGDMTRITRSERISIVGWNEEYLVYWQVIEGTSQGNPERSKLFSYNTTTGERIELAAANYFNDVQLVDGVVYYAVSGFAVPESYARLFEVRVNGEQKVQVLDKQVYSIFRTGLDTLLYSAADQEWFEQKLPNRPEPTERRTSVPDAFSYVFSPSKESAAWVRVRDGQGVLEYARVADEQGTTNEAATDAGIRQPLYWLGDKAIVYRVIKSGETADYLVSLDRRPNGSEQISKVANITIQTYYGY